jgi:hypothetical protein
MWDLTALYNSAMSNCMHPDRITSIFISMLFEPSQQLTALENTVKEIDARLGNTKELIK